MIGRRITSLFNPDRFQGWGKTRKYFEGWYFKLVNREESRAFAIIPGVAMDSAGNAHSFVQVLDGKANTAEYHKFDFESFSAAADRFMVSIGNNRFSGNSLSLDLPGFSGDLFFSGNVPWPRSWRSPGIMGPYSFVPFMECYHGIVSMDHAVEGVLRYGKEEIDFTGGRGYTEKDWGTSFPEGYIWLQTNHFNEPGISLKISVAKIPWLRSSFVGFIAGLWIKDRLISFSSYNGSVLGKVQADQDKVVILVSNSRYSLEVSAGRGHATSLASPVGGLMEGRIGETMTSLVEVILIDRRKGGGPVFAGTGRNCCLEVAGKVEGIITGS
jgi:tocopherol cyclase